MKISKLIAKSVKFTDLRLFKLSTLLSWEGASILSALGDTFVLGWTVGIGSNCEVVRCSKRNESILKDENTTKDGFTF